MTVKITRVEPTNQISASGKKKYYAYTDEGDRHIAWGDWVLEAPGQDVDAIIKKESFKGNDYTVLWPARESSSAQSSKAPAAIASSLAVGVRPRLVAEPEEKEVATSPKEGKLSQAYWEKRDRLMARESALKSAAEVWSTKLSVGLDDTEKTNPLDLAKEFYSWITS